MTSPWLLRKFYKFVLKRAIGRFLHNELDLDQLDVQLGEGKLLLRDLVLSKETVNGALADTSLRMDSGFIGDLTVKIPWHNIFGDHCVVELDHVEMTLLCDGAWDESMAQSIPLDASVLLDAARDFHTRGEDLTSAEDTWGDGDGDDAPSQDVGESADDDTGLDVLTGLIEQILARVEIVVKDLFVRVIATSPSTGESVTMTLHMPHIRLIDETPSLSSDAGGASGGGGGVRGGSGGGAGVAPRAGAGSAAPPVAWNADADDPMDDPAMYAPADDGGAGQHAAGTGVQVKSIVFSGMSLQVEAGSALQRAPTLTGERIDSPTASESGDAPNPLHATILRDASSRDNSIRITWQPASEAMAPCVDVDVFVHAVDVLVTPKQLVLLNQFSDHLSEVSALLADERGDESGGDRGGAGSGGGPGVPLTEATLRTAGHSPSCREGDVLAASLHEADLQAALQEGAFALGGGGGGGGAHDVFYELEHDAAKAGRAPPAAPSGAPSAFRCASPTSTNTYTYADSTTVYGGTFVEGDDSGGTAAGAATQWTVRVRVMKMQLVVMCDSLMDMSVAWDGVVPPPEGAPDDPITRTMRAQARALCGDHMMVHLGHANVRVINVPADAEDAIRATFSIHTLHVTEHLRTGASEAAPLDVASGTSTIFYSAVASGGGAAGGGAAAGSLFCTRPVLTVEAGAPEAPFGAASVAAMQPCIEGEFVRAAPHARVDVQVQPLRWDWDITWGDRMENVLGALRGSAGKHAPTPPTSPLVPRAEAPPAAVAAEAAGAPTAAALAWAVQVERVHVVVHYPSQRPQRGYHSARVRPHRAQRMEVRAGGVCVSSGVSEDEDDKGALCMSMQHAELQVALDASEDALHSLVDARAGATVRVWQQTHTQEDLASAPEELPAAHESQQQQQRQHGTGARGSVLGFVEHESGTRVSNDHSEDVLRFQRACAATSSVVVNVRAPDVEMTTTKVQFDTMMHLIDVLLATVFADDDTGVIEGDGSALGDSFLSDSSLSSFGSDSHAHEPAAAATMYFSHTESGGGDMFFPAADEHEAGLEVLLLPTSACVELEIGTGKWTLTESTPTDINFLDGCDQVLHTYELHARNLRLFQVTGFGGRAENSVMMTSEDMALHGTSVEGNIMPILVRTTLADGQVPPRSGACAAALHMNVFKSPHHATGGVAAREQSVALTFRGLTLRHESATVWLMTFVDVLLFDDPHAPVPGTAGADGGESAEAALSSSSAPPSSVTHLFVDFFATVIDYDAKQHPARVALLIGACKLTCNIVTGAPALVFRFTFADVEAMLVDDVAKLRGMESVAAGTVRGMHEERGFVPVATSDVVEMVLTSTKEPGKARMVVEVTHGVMRLATCYDSFDTLIALFTHYWECEDVVHALDEDARLREEIERKLEMEHEHEAAVAVLEQGGGLLHSVNENAFGVERSVGDGGDAPARGAADLSQSMLLSADAASQVVHALHVAQMTLEEEAEQRERRVGEQMRHVHASAVQSIALEPSAEWYTGREPLVLAHHFRVPLVDALDDREPLPASYPPPVLKVFVHDFSLMWRLFGGEDWQPDAPTPRPPARGDSDDEGAGEPDAHAQMLRMYAPPPPEERMSRRDTTRMMEVSVRDLLVRVDRFADNVPNVARIVLSAAEVEVLDCLRTSSWRKFLCFLRTPGQPHIGDGTMVRIELDMLRVRLTPDVEQLENRMRLTLLPLRFNIDQDALDFVLYFFVPAMRSAGATGGAAGVEKGEGLGEGEGEEEDGAEAGGAHVRMLHGDELVLDTTAHAGTFFQNVVVDRVHVRIDYQPKRLDLEGLAQGRAEELVNLFALEGVELDLERVQLERVFGWDQVAVQAGVAWGKHIADTQLYRYFAGIAPLRSLVNIGNSLRDFIVMPVQEFRRKNQVPLRSVRQGTTSLLRTVALEALHLSSKVATSAQAVLETADAALSSATGAAPAVRSNTLANQPSNATEGLEQAWKGLSRGFRDASDHIVMMPVEEYRRSGAGGLVRKVIRAVPVAVLRPMIGTTEAVTKTLLGVRNQVDPVAHKDASDKFK